MAQQQINVNIPSVGSSGLNTEDSPITQDYSYAAVADNAVIDNFGRIGAREAFSTDTLTFPVLPAIATAVTHEVTLDVIEGSLINELPSILCTGRNIGYDADGNVVGTNYYIFERVGSALVEITLPAVTDLSKLSLAQIVPTDDRYYIFSPTNEVMVWNGTTITLISAAIGYYGIQLVPSGAQVAPTFDRGIAAYGRVWATGHGGDSNTIYYSDLLIGASAYTVDGLDPASTAGKLNVLENWPNGKDTIVGLSAHNNRLIVFGREAILVYNAGYGDPADAASGFTLEDTITNVGCVSKYSLVNIGTDVLFVDETGVRSLGRTIQERSSPMGNLTNKVRKQFSDVVSETEDSQTIRMEYDPSNNFAVVLFSEQELAYCLDMKAYRAEGLAKITRWTDCFFNDLTYVDSYLNPVMLLAGMKGKGVLGYSGYLSSSGNTYILKYYSNQLTFGEPARTKFIKQIDYTIISSITPSFAYAKWGYDGLNTYKSKYLILESTVPAYFGIAKFNIGIFGTTPTTIKRYRVNTGGAGESVKIGIEVTIDGNGCSLQEINVQTLIGRIN